MSCPAHMGVSGQALTHSVRICACALGRAARHSVLHTLIPHVTRADKLRRSHARTHEDMCTHAHATTPFDVLTRLTRNVLLCVATACIQQAEGPVQAHGCAKIVSLIHSVAAQLQVTILISTLMPKLSRLHFYHLSLFILNIHILFKHA